MAEGMRKIQHLRDALSDKQEREKNFLELVKSAHTFQELIWATERLRTQLDHSTDLERELIVIEAEEEVDPEYGMSNIREYPDLLKKVLELRTRRAEYNSEYRREVLGFFSRESEQSFTVHAVNLEGKPVQEESEYPIIIAPGFTVGHEAVRRNCVGLAELHHSALTFEVPPESTSYDSSKQYQDGLNDFGKKHVSALLHTVDVANEKIFEKPRQYNVIGYSFGAIVAINAAIAEPEKFHSIVLINPGGLSHLDNSYLLRFVKMVKNSFAHRAQVLKEAGKQKRSLLEMATEPGPSMFEPNRDAAFHREFSTDMDRMSKKGGVQYGIDTGSTISQTNLVPLIQKLEELGIKVTILAAEDDPLFPVDMVLKSGEKAGVPAHDMKGAHANLGFNPGSTSALCIDAFKQMDPKGEGAVHQA